MLPNPLHPAIVHFPIVLAFLLPIVAGGALWAIRRGTSPRRAWAVPLAGAVALALSAWVAVETGEAQDEQVERVVAEQPLSAHEEMAEFFLTASVVLAAVSAAGLIGGVAGRTARLVTTAGSLGLIVASARVGHSGGQLVYRYGAASAYASPRSADSSLRRSTDAEARSADARSREARRSHDDVEF